MNKNTLIAWLDRILELIGVRNLPEVELDIPPADPAENMVPPLGSEGLDSVENQQLKNIRKFASRSDDSGKRQLEELVAAFKTTHPEHEDKIDLAMEQGKKLKELKNTAFNTAASHGKDSKQVAEFRKKVQADFPWALDPVQSQIKNGHAAFQKWNNERKMKRSGKPLTSVKPPRKSKAQPTKPILHSKPSQRPVASTHEILADLHPSDLRGLSTSPHWTILIDETGSEFGPEADRAKFKNQGRFVAVALPGESPALSPLPIGWHAADVPNEEVDRAVQSLLNAKAGILGISVNSLPVTPGERWMDGVGLLIDWTLRLLPVAGPTKIKVQIENRAPFDAGQPWELVARDCLRRLALAFPASAGWIDLEVSVIAKTGSPYNGYPDAIAYTWARTSDSSKERLKQSELLHTCLYEYDARTLLGAWDNFAHGVHLPPHSWWDFLPESAGSGLVSSLLQKIGLESQADLTRWTAYLDETRHRMASGAVDLSRLGLAVDWLQTHQPSGASIPPLLRLGWLTVQLAEANHLGAAEAEWERELAELSAPLIEESAPLVCYADLHLAVTRTNRFDFVGASRALAKWADQDSSVPGLLHWAQVRSSLGQHAAFTGQHKKAVALFDEALAAFSRLSDPAVRAKELSQTGCYRAIALIDDPEVTDEVVREALERVIGPLPQAINHYVGSNDPSDRYAHHLLLRWLVHRGDEALAKAYVAKRDDWQTGFGHPWPLIQIYRALLIYSRYPKEALELAENAVELTRSGDQGPVVQLIGECIRKIAATWGSRMQATPGVLAALRDALPKATEQINALEAWTQGNSLDLLRDTLPFNFR